MFFKTIIFGDDCIKYVLISLSGLLINFGQTLFVFGARDVSLGPYSNYIHFIKAVIGTRYLYKLLTLAKVLDVVNSHRGIYVQTQNMIKDHHHNYCITSSSTS